MPPLLEPLFGDQVPRYLHSPAAPSTSGRDAIELAAACGLVLDPWQELCLEHALREDNLGKWAAFEVGLVVARQNGKGSILEARELAGLFLFGEKLIIHSAHEFSTSMEAQRRLVNLIEENDEFSARVKAVRRSHGEEGIELKPSKSYNGSRSSDGARILFRTRTKSGARGLSGDLVVLDEAMILDKQAISALLFTLAARPNPQVWYTGSAVDELVMPNGEVLAAVRQRGIEGTDPRLAFFEWSNPKGADPSNPKTWQRANPGMGYRLSAEHTQKEYESMRTVNLRGFEVERCSTDAYWPKLTDAKREYVIDPNGVFSELVAPKDSELTEKVVLALDMPPNRRHVDIAAAVLREDGNIHVEIGYHGPVLGAVEYLQSIVTRWNPFAVVVDRLSPAASLEADLLAAGIEPHITGATEMAAACGGLYDAVVGRQLSHMGDPLLIEALESADKRDMQGGGWAWKRAGEQTISPVVAVSLAHWGLRLYLSTEVQAPQPAPRFGGGSAVTASGGSGFDVMTAGF